MANTVTQVATIRKTYERAKAENLGISEHFIRSACLTGKLKHNRAGRTILIYFPNLIELLQNGDQLPQEQTQEPQIKPIDVR